MFSKYFKSCDQAILRAAVEEVYLKSFTDLSVFLETVLFFKWAGWRLRCNKPSSLLTLCDLENIQPTKNDNEKQETNLENFDKGFRFYLELTGIIQKGDKYSRIKVFGNSEHTNEKVKKFCFGVWPINGRRFGFLVYRKTIPG